MNSMLGERLSIISSKPQTTRKNILGIISDENHQIIFLDTPGILEPAYLLQEKMVEFINQAIKDADILLVLFDIDADPDGKEILNDENIFLSIQKNKATKIAVINKVDLSNDIRVKRLAEKLENTKLFDELIIVSAYLGYNIDILLNIIKEALPFGPKYYPDDQISNENERFFVSEIIREKIFELYQDEIPFSTEVLIEDYKERENAKDFISASIIVEKETQKPIIIGKGGDTIKKLGRISRASIENFLGREVYLELRVKVRPKWRSNQNLLKNFGYSVGNE
ncbi:gtp-binding protein era [hydrocarbon metagenome]|uniref:Gtp-binding protein era n=1 Tax=hydrocarbon metagenome TaxID=938273 RepID=A0A0W8FZG1_9ZZZZ